jgi:hypothetical protein
MKPAGSGDERDNMTVPEIVRRAHGVQIQAGRSPRGQGRSCSSSFKG